MGRYSNHQVIQTGGGLFLARTAPSASCDQMIALRLVLAPGPNVLVNHKHDGGTLRLELV